MTGLPIVVIAVCVALMSTFTFQQSGFAGLSNIKIRRDDMKRQKRSIYVAGLALFIVFAVVSTIFSAPVNYRQVATIANIPGNLSGGFDISWADAVAGRYYLADRGTTSIDV